MGCCAMAPPARKPRPTRVGRCPASSGKGRMGLFPGNGRGKTRDVAVDGWSAWSISSADLADSEPAIPGSGRC